MSQLVRIDRNLTYLQGDQLREAIQEFNFRDLNRLRGKSNQQIQNSFIYRQTNGSLSNPNLSSTHFEYNLNNKQVQTFRFRFGLLTVTHSRNGDYSVLQKYLRKYAQTDCYKEFISEINLVWNNEQSPDSTSIFKRKLFWKIPVYFYRTTFNSMDHRYRLPKDSSAQLLYSLDDDIMVDCLTFKTTLEEYNRAGNGRLGRIVTNQVRGFKFQASTLEDKQFIYQGHPQAVYFTISEPGAAFIPRHYLQLYYLKLNEFIELRNIVLDVKNCDDIFFYAFVQHFYPQLPAVYVKGQKGYKNTDPKVGQSKVKNVYPLRSKCIGDISKALGYNPLRYYSKQSKNYLGNWKFENLKTILEQKIRGFYDVEFQQPIQKKIVEQSIANQQVAPQQQFKQKEIPVSKSSINQTQNKQEIVQKDIENLKQVDKMINKSKQETLDRKNNSDTSFKLNNNITSQNRTIEKVIHQTEQQNTSYINLSPEREIFLYIILIIFLSILCIRLYKYNCNIRKQYRIKIAQQEEYQSSSIKLPDRF